MTTWGLVIDGEVHRIAVVKDRGLYRAGNGGECSYGWGGTPFDAMLDLRAGEGRGTAGILAPEEMRIHDAAVAAERARCAAVCREVAAQAVGPLALDAGVRRGATTCAEAIERGAVAR